MTGYLEEKDNDKLTRAKSWVAHLPSPCKNFPHTGCQQTEVRMRLPVQIKTARRVHLRSFTRYRI